MKCTIECDIEVLLYYSVYIEFVCSYAIILWEFSKILYFFDNLCITLYYKYEYFKPAHPF